MLTLCFVFVLANGFAPVGSSSDGGSLIINELMIDPLESSTTELGQWIELYNNSGDWVNLSEWIIRNQNGEEIHFSAHAIPPNGYYVVGASGLNNENGDYVPNAVWGDFSLSLIGSLLLTDGEADSQEFVSWNGSWDLKPGSSLERMNPGWAAADFASWLHSTSQYGAGDMGTPGSQNSVFSNGFGQNTWAFIKAFVN